MKIAVVGASGRMGLSLIQAVHRLDASALTGAVERAGSAAVGADAGTLAGLGPIGVTISDDPIAIIAKADALLDFTTPEASCAYSELTAQARIVHVIGTTGFTPAHEATLRAAARHATIVKAGNMSLGVNLLLALTRKIAQALDPEYDIEIVEMHHRHKVDAPSGTALMLGQAAAEGRGIDLIAQGVRARDGQTGARPPGSIGFQSLRGGTVVGEHTVIFAGENERIEITHKAADRSIFASGAVKAARWGYNEGKGRGPGLFSMTDVLGL